MKSDLNTTETKTPAPIFASTQLKVVKVHPRHNQAEIQFTLRIKEIGIILDSVNWNRAESPSHAIAQPQSRRE